MRKILSISVLLLISTYVFGQNVGVSQLNMTPTSLFHVHSNATGQLFQLSNSSTTGGNTPTANSGFNIGIDASMNISLNQFENAKMSLYTNNVERITVLGTGAVGIGTNNPTANYLMTIQTNATFPSGISLPLSGAGSTSYGINISASNANYRGIYVTNSSNAGTAFYGISANISSGTATTAYLGYHNSSLKNFGLYVTDGDWAGFIKGKFIIANFGVNFPDATINTGDFEIQNLTTGANNPANITLRQSTQTTTSGNLLGNIIFSDQSQAAAEAQILALRDAASGGTSDLPTALTFSTTPDGSASISERVRITNAGFVGINTNNPSTLLHVDGSTAVTTQTIATISGNSLTTGKGLSVVSSSLTTGNLLDVRVSNSVTGGDSYSIYAENASTGANAKAICAKELSTSGVTFGIDAQNASNDGYAMRAWNTSTTNPSGANFSGRVAALFAQSDAENTIGLFGYSSSNTAVQSAGIWGITNGINGYGVVGIGSNIGMSFSQITGGIGGYLMGAQYGAYSKALGTGATAYGLYSTATGAATTNYGIYGTASGAATNYASYFEGDAIRIPIKATAGDPTGTWTAGALYFNDNTNKLRLYYDAAWNDIGGGSGWPSCGVAGSVQFSDGSSGFNCNATKFFWDNTNERLGIGVGSPSYFLDVQPVTGVANPIIFAKNANSNTDGTMGIRGEITNYGYGVLGYYNSTIASGAGVYGNSGNSGAYGVFGRYSAANYGYLGGNGYGVYGTGSTWAGYFASAPIGLSASQYINWGATAGTTGYGFRDNAGIMEYKNSAGAWTAFNGHLQLHTITSTTDHSAGNWKVFYSNGSGQVIELALPVAGQVLTSAGAAAAPVWGAAGGSGTVTNIATGTGLTGGPITTTGTISLIVPVSIANGGTNITTIGAAGSVIYSNATQHASTAVGTAGQILMSNGAGAPTWVSYASITAAQTVVVPACGVNWTVPAGVTRITVEVWGGGGGGGSTGVNASGGGGAGGYGKQTFTVVPGSNHMVTCGAGGAVGAAGGASSLGALISATGGGGCAGGAGAVGGVGGTSAGTFNIPGGQGAGGSNNPTRGGDGGNPGGNGGSGGGGAGYGAGVPAACVGTSPGGGGGGGTAGGAAAAGGAGKVVIYY
ncbi:MAG: hypothetical protein V1904_05030 [Bacteroidota bacterium]